MQVCILGLHSSTHQANDMGQRRGCVNVEKLAGVGED